MDVDATSEMADTALQMVLSDTEGARDLAAEVLDRAGIAPRTQMTALFALGRAQVELGRPGEAVQPMYEARDLAVELGDDEMRSLISSRLAVALFENGRPEDALDVLDSASEVGSAHARGTAQNSRGMILVHSGRLREGKEAFDKAVEELEEAGDNDMVVRALASRSVAAVRLGDFAAAEADLVRSTELAESLGMAAIVAGNLHNLAYVRSQRGMIPEALEAYGEARDGYREAGAPARAMAILDTDAAETLLTAGLHDEALEAADRTREEAQSTGHAVQQAESELLRARIFFAAGRMDECLEAAGHAAELFDRSGRAVWTVQANSLRVQAQDDAERRVDDLHQLVEELDEHGWDTDVQLLLTLLSRTLLHRGDLDGARTALERAAKGRRQVSASVQASLWHARALLRVAEGDRTGALQALRSGMGVLDEYRAALGATELRVRAARHAAELASLGLKLSVEADEPVDALRWSEYGRAQALRVPPARPPRDETLASELAELRRSHADARDVDLTEERAAELSAEIASVERRVREHARLARGSENIPADQVDVRALRAQLGDRVLVEFFESEEKIWAVVIDTGSVRLVELCAVADAAAALDTLMFALRRLAAGRGSPASLDAVRQGLEHSVSELSELLSVALPDTPELVVVPSAALQAVPWQLLGTHLGCSVVMAPSAAIWMRESSAPSGEVSARIIAGPGLPAAASEATRLHAMYAGSNVLLGDAATTDASLAAAAEADVLHIAAHGTFRGDSPMFSALHLADGPLTIYDIERLTSVPDTVVLSACHAAAGEVAVGNEVMGTAMALVGMGVRSVVAPLVAVADDATEKVMVAMHEGMLGGESPQGALARLVDVWAGEDPMSAVTAGSFVVIGSDRPS